MKKQLLISMCAMAILALSTTSCVVYHPHNVDIPLLHEKGELQADASFSLSAPLLAAPAVNASIAYAPIDVLGLQGGISVTSPTNFYAQGAAGAYLPFEKTVFEFYLGYGYGLSGHEKWSNLNDHKFRVDGRYGTIFGQANIGWVNLADGLIDVGFGLKGGSLKGHWERVQINDDATETVVNTKDGPQLLVEPQFVFRIGWERIKFSFNLSYAYLHDWKVNNDYFLYDPFSVAVGMHFKL